MAFQIDFEKYRRRMKKKHLALYLSIKDRILSGSLSDGSLLPSSRDLSSLYGISRGTASLAYEMLAADGYIRTRAGKGTFISFSGQTEKTGEKREKIRLSRWTNRAIPYASPADHLRGIHFYPGYPDRENFPHVEWRKSISRALRKYDSIAQAVHPAGLRDLREKIAAHLGYHRGIRAGADNIVIVNGSLQAIGLLSHMLLDAGDSAVIEDPGYAGTRNSVKTAGGKILFAPVDRDGIRVRGLKGKIAFVTPTHQFPTGVVLSQERRNELIAWASRNNAVIIEDDFDSEFRRKGRPLEPLKALSPERVVYMGTFSRTMSLSMRIGYVVLPESLFPHFLRVKQIFETYSAAWMEQAALADFMSSGQYERHLRRMTRVYRKSHDALKLLFKEHLPGLFEWTDSDAGLHLFGQWRGNARKFRAFHQACVGEDLHWRTAEGYYHAASQPAGVFSFSHLNERSMEKALSAMGAIYRRLK